VRERFGPDWKGDQHGQQYRNRGRGEGEKAMKLHGRAS
jgi:hypothetical protein